MHYKRQQMQRRLNGPHITGFDLDTFSVPYGLQSRNYKSAQKPPNWRKPSLGRR